MNVRYLSLLGLGAALTLLIASSPASGTWKLNTAKSSYSSGTGLKSRTMQLSEEGDWVVRKTESVDAEGNATTTLNRYKLDGKEYDWKGPTASGKLRVKKIDDRHAEWVFKDGAGLVVEGRTVLSEDGKILTESTTATNAKGETRKSVLVFDRQ
jgi:hypothetical protein